MRLIYAEDVKDSLCNSCLQHIQGTCTQECNLVKSIDNIPTARVHRPEFTSSDTDEVDYELFEMMDF